LYLGTANAAGQPDIQEQWEKNIPGHITKADANWPVIKDRAPAELS
jgi:hypothetical protein